MKQKLFALLLCFLLLPPALSLAHPGKTDSKGGHTDRSTGEYHYHHGYPAHQHSGGVCPYNFDDKTGQHSGSSSNSTKSTSSPLAVVSRTLSTPPPKPSVASSAPGANTDSNKIWIGLLGTSTIVLGASALALASSKRKAVSQAISSEINRNTAISTEKDRLQSKCDQLSSKLSEQEETISSLVNSRNALKASLSATQRQLSAEQERSSQLLKERDAALKKAAANDEKAKQRAYFESHSLRELAGMPSDTVIGPDGLPKERNAVGWGDTYTRYIHSSASVKYHKNGCEFATHPMHVYDPLLPQHSCHYCHPAPLPDREWYDLYLELAKYCKLHGFTPLPDDPPPNNIIQFSLKSDPYHESASVIR